MRVKIDKHDEKCWTKMIAVLEYTCLTIKGLDPFSINGSKRKDKNKNKIYRSRHERARCKVLDENDCGAGVHLFNKRSGQTDRGNVRIKITTFTIDA